MPAKPKPGMVYRQEYYEGEAEDVGQVLSVDAKVTVPFGTFDNAVKTAGHDSARAGPRRIQVLRPGRRARAAHHQGRRRARGTDQLHEVAAPCRRGDLPADDPPLDAAHPVAALRLRPVAAASAVDDVAGAVLRRRRCSRCRRCRTRGCVRRRRTTGPAPPWPRSRSLPSPPRIRSRPRPPRRTSFPRLPSTRSRPLPPPEPVVAVAAAQHVVAAPAVDAVVARRGRRSRPGRACRAGRRCPACRASCTSDFCPGPGFALGLRLLLSRLRGGGTPWQVPAPESVKASPAGAMNRQA